VLRWVSVGGVPHLPLEDWFRLTQFRAFADRPSGRVLLERKGQPPLILLLGSRYALQGERFLSLPHAPLQKGSQVLFSAESGERLFLAALPAGEREGVTVALKTATKAQAPATLPPAAAKEKTPSAGVGCNLDRPVQRIFLDPGHGGEDAGTKHGHLLEKEIVLKFASLAADELRRRGFTVSFSRTRDVFLPLDVRTKIAEKWKADVFISLHVNHSDSPSAQGTETYILSQEATDAAARKLALLENSIAEKAKASDGAVQDILWDMEQTAYLQDSAYLASYLQGAIVENAKALLAQKKLPGEWKNRGVLQAPFYVLNRAPMPAVLVELGYLSNARDRKLLPQKFFQESLAKALADGVKKYKEACRTHH
jgi:N-acetylmuramoyl-L-alanine amidase